MIQVLINRYEHRLDAYIKEIEEYCSKRNKNQTDLPPVSPSYLDEVIMPVFISLSENLPKKLGKFIVPDRKTYLPIIRYYRIKIGRKIVGGFLIPDGDSFNLYFVPLKSTIQIGDKVKIESVEQLIEIISDIIKKNKGKRYDK